MRQMFDSMFEIENTDYSYLVEGRVGGGGRVLHGKRSRK